MRLSGSPAARASCCCRLQNDLCLSSRGQAVDGLRRADISGAPFSLRACVGLHSTHRRTTGSTLRTVALPRHPRSFDSSLQAQTNKGSRKSTDIERAPRVAQASQGKSCRNGCCEKWELTVSHRKTAER
eukprot:m.411126 g.411126  ORF g.411126 m.411126 type:complete len:129 (-) comp56550_c0_seq3:304-690(-)